MATELHVSIAGQCTLQ